MEVVGYLNHADLLLQDETHCMIIEGSHYVLSLGDRVYIQHLIDTDLKLYAVKISFIGAQHLMLHEDEVQVKFEGDKSALAEYLRETTVH
ncbi:hypothetical protein E0H82_09540 [Acinetobacter sp. ANC 4910]|uniref:hypothetical protein n=1 Tax=Acinetobacter sp. ANC 4910 TaxID=2529850 RepID=UPI00103A1678|nr:hypothetical protein [Acinetobacter sp. ANC 4910]TCB34905.1 hypothetical protein E0H82_09540 [Acinetobacter sp. ANC 4910]